MLPRPMTKSDDELHEKLRKLRGPSPPPRPLTPFSDIPIQLKSEILISTNFLKSYLKDGHLKPCVFSPAVISASLTIILSGANKEILCETEKVFGQNFICDEKCFEGLIYFNTLIYSNKLTLLPSFIDYCNKNVKHHLLPVDFDNFEETVKEINSKVSEKTQNKITKFLDASEIFLPNPSLFIGSAATFVSQWAFSFPFDPPKPRMFHSNPPRKIDMIRQKQGELWMYSEGDDWTCMSLIYGNGIPRKLFIILPKEINGLPDLIEKFDYSMIRECIKGSDVLATATIPIFEIESTTIFNDKLKDMGIKKLFDKNSLDKLINISNDTSQNLDLVVHAARIKVDQFGADGRDDSADHLRYEDIRIQPGSLAPKPECQEIEFIADRPFIFFVALWKFSDGKDSKDGLHSIQFAGIFS